MFFVGRAADGVLALGASPADVLVLHTTPGDHNYEASVKLDAERGVEAGLVLYYGPKTYAGIAAKDGYIFSIARGEMTANSLIEAPAAKYFRIRLFEFDLTMQYSEDGSRWKTYPYSLEVSGYHHNMLGGFSSLKLGIYCLGDGRLRVDDFNYRALD